MKFKTKLQLRIALSFPVIAVGVLAVLFSLSMIQTDNHLPEFMRGFYIGTGLGLIASGIATIIRNALTLTNEARFKKAELNDRDERNKFIFQKSCSIAMMITLFALYVAVLACGAAFPPLVAVTLLCALAFAGLTLIVCMTIIKKLS